MAAQRSASRLRLPWSPSISAQSRARISASPISAMEEEPAVATLLDLTAGERRRIFRTALTAAWGMAERLITELTRQKRAQKVAAARREAAELAARLQSVSAEKRRRLIDLFPEFRSWAVAEALCNASVRAASHSVDEAMELALLALSVAERLPGEAERARAAGYCWGFVGNARRVRHQLFSLRFKTVKHFCQQGRYAAAERLLPAVREMAIE
jgi:hypothetical protein